MKKITNTISLMLLLVLAGGGLFAQSTTMPLLEISANQRYFATADGKPFFWLGDTGWLLLTKCTREEAIQYLDVRKKQGFNVIQVMLLHTLKAVNVYNDSALVQHDISRPDLKNKYWAHVDFVIKAAAARGIYMALVPVWGGNVKDGHVSVEQAEAYAAFLAKRYGPYNNIIWLNGGDIKGSDGYEVWQSIGATLKRFDKRHLVTFHPRGRTSSSEWFHQAAWLDFNMFQSGHKDYSQDTSSNETNHYGEDNWRFVVKDLGLSPKKPTLDAEPSYENIPHGLHDSLEERWTDADLRRYAYWSVFAGGAGFTYGENSVMQFHGPGDKGASFGPDKNWKHTLHAPGAGQMKYLKQLMESKPFSEGVPAQEILPANELEKYDYLLATKGRKYGMVYTYTGRKFSVDLSKLSFVPTTAAWYNPRNGKQQTIAKKLSKAIINFDPPGQPSAGNDWVLIIKK